MAHIDEMLPMRYFEAYLSLTDRNFSAICFRSAIILA